MSWRRAEHEYRRALDLNPNSAATYHRYTFLLLRMERPDEALRAIRRAHQLDPLSPVIHRLLVESLVRAGQVEPAKEEARKMLELHSENYDAHFGAGFAYILMSMDQEAIWHLEKASRLSGGNAKALALLAHSYVTSGRTAEAEKLLNKLKEKPNSTSVAFQIAGISAELGRNDETFEWLENCYQAHCAAMVHLKDQNA